MTFAKGCRSSKLREVAEGVGWQGGQRMVGYRYGTNWASWGELGWCGVKQSCGVEGCSVEVG